MEKWKEVKDRKTPWTDEDKDKLDKLKKKEIKFNDTALGRLVNVLKREHQAAFCSSSHDEQKILKQLSNIHDAAKDLVGKAKDTGNKNRTATLPDIRSVDGTWGSDEEGNRDVTVVANEATI